MTNKLPLPPTPNEIVGKINEIIDDKQDTLVSGTNIKTINNTSLLGSGNIDVGSGSSFIPYGESDSVADATEKTVTISEITELKTGQIIIVKPTVTSTVADATLKLNNFAAYPILYGTAAITTSTDSITWAAGYPSWFRFDGSNWVFLGHGVDNNTTYSTMSVAEGTAGTASSNRSLQARYLKQIIQGTTLTGISTSTTGAVTASDTVTTGIGKLQATKADKSAIPTVNNATLTIQKNGTNVATFTANASNNVTANISVPNVTSTYTATGTDAVNGVAVSNAIATKQDTLVSGTNIKTINGTSILGSGNITIETSSTPNVDGETISYNMNDALQAIAVKNVRDGSTLPIWHGTEQQWNRGVATTWYYWQTSVTALWTASTLPSSANWRSETYGDGKFVAVTNNSDKSAYSTDGINWTESTMPSSANWWSVTYGDGKFVAVTNGSNKSAYSTDGINWTASTMPSSADWMSVTYGDGKFVAVAYGSNKSAYSTDGINWTASTMPSSAYWRSVTYGDGKFVAVAYDSKKSAYSTDGINWTASTLPSSANWLLVTYGDDKFVAVAFGSNKSAYSTDGINWTASTMPSSAYWYSVTYGDDKFVAVAFGSNKSAYSTDGINWTASTMPSSANWMSVTYGDGKFVAVANGSDASAIFTIQYDKCYTDTANPTTTSVVYSEPETVSSYTISSVTSGAITLSNNNTYYYNQSGNAYTYQSVGVAHPEYLCFIDGVGVKIGTTTIATNS
ncbi:MAG: hypothetical protein IJ077_08560 [Eubacterium sp.]|nr:hypothetical protein [Eubacterium sp.]